MTAEVRAEYMAWQAVVQAWPGDINDPKFNPVVEAIHTWGNALVSLRLSVETRLAQPAQIDEGPAGPVNLNLNPNAQAQPQAFPKGRWNV